MIANDYLLPKIRDQVKFTKEDICIPDATIQYLVENFCSKEDGVRTLKRCLETIYTKANLHRLIRPGTKMLTEDSDIVIEFPLTVTNSIVDKLIKRNSKMNPSLSHLYI